VKLAFALLRIRIFCRSNEAVTVGTNPAMADRGAFRGVGGNFSGATTAR
jgi:hypothetical protein